MIARTCCLSHSTVEPASWHLLPLPLSRTHLILIAWAPVYSAAYLAPIRVVILLSRCCTCTILVAAARVVDIILVAAAPFVSAAYRARCHLATRLAA